jgi:hypothetical protein
MFLTYVDLFIGMVGYGEQINLVREPNNKYDR